jgi:hypothetical protein
VLLCVAPRNHGEKKKGLSHFSFTQRLKQGS